MNCKRIETQRVTIPHLFLFLIFFTMAFLAVSPPAWSQQVTAAITGKVTDSSGGTILGAKVTAKDLDRGTLWEAETNNQGFYNLPRIPVGRYEIRVEAGGFQTAIHPASCLN